ncbi:MAG TPA: phosphatase PAP2 family protein [Acetobacteraceae bacterium]|nr:phosphatase PAP2 family protein [Acetobacteraceae bacterium]
MRFLTDFADQAVMLPVVFAIAVVLALQGWRRGALAWLGVVGVTFTIMLALKIVFLSCPPVFGPTDIRSPSGHVAAATVVAGGLASLLLRRRASILPIAVLAGVVIGLSRLVLGLHSLPEVALGALVGLGGAVALMRLAGPPPVLRISRLLAVVVIVAALFHGLHLPAEAAIRHTALSAARLLAVCQPSTLPAPRPGLPGGGLPRGGLFALR